jgi:hypothetical protein
LSEWPWNFAEELKTIREGVDVDSGLRIHYRHGIARLSLEKLFVLVLKCPGMGLN